MMDEHWTNEDNLYFILDLIDEYIELKESIDGEY